MLSKYEVVARIPHQYEDEQVIYVKKSEEHACISDKSRTQPASILKYRYIGTETHIIFEAEALPEMKKINLLRGLNLIVRFIGRNKRERSGPKPK